MRRRARIFETLIGVLSVSAVMASVVWLRPGQRLAGGVIVFALAWSTAAFAIDALLAPANRTVLRKGTRASVTTIVCVGEEPEDVARASVILTAQLGPAVVVSTIRRAFLTESELGHVPVFVDEAFSRALDDAIASVDTDAVFITSASAYPTAEVADLAGALHDDVGWAIGRTQSLARDAYAPGAEDQHGSRLRSCERAGGLVVWEPDATVVRRDLLEPLVTRKGQPRGAFLRKLAALGYTGVEADVVVARRAAATEAPGFWPSQVLRARGVAADMAGGMRTGSIRTRALAFAGLSRELAAFRLVLWLCVPILIAWGDAFPFVVGPVAFVSLHVVLAMSRWAAVRVRVGTQLHPAQSALAAVYNAPASLLALVSALTARIRPLRVRFIDQPLLLTAIAVTVAVAIPLVDRPRTADAGIDVTVGFAIVALAGLWVCAIHAVGPGTWSRSAYRIVLDAPAEVAGVSGRLRDASPSGAAAVGAFGDVRVGELVDLCVSLPNATTVTVPANVTDRRHGGADEIVLGLALVLDRDSRARWLRALGTAQAGGGVTSSDLGGRRAARRRQARVDVVPHRRASRLIRRVEVAVVTLLSLAMLAAVTLAMVGYQALVVRSPSMTPTLAVGDIAIIDWTRAADIEVGDVITFEVPEVGIESVTHRVRSITAARGGVSTFETRGDANDESEIWTTSGDTLVGRVVGRVPAVGGVAAELGRLRPVIILVAISFAVVFGGLLLARRRPRASAPQRDFA